MTVMPRSRIVAGHLATAEPMTDSKTARTPGDGRVLKVSTMARQVSAEALARVAIAFASHLGMEVGQLDAWPRDLCP